MLHETTLGKLLKVKWYCGFSQVVLVPVEIPTFPPVVVICPIDDIPLFIVEFVGDVFICDILNSICFT